MAERGAANAPKPMSYELCLWHIFGEVVYHMQHVYNPFYIQSLFEESQ